MTLLPLVDIFAVDCAIVSALLAEPSTKVVELLENLQCLAVFLARHCYSPFGE